MRSHRPEFLLALLALTVTAASVGCAEEDGRKPSDAHLDAGTSDASQVDAGPSDAGLDDAALPDAGHPPADAGPGAGMLCGSVSYDRRPIGATGLGAVTAEPLAGATVLLLRGGAEADRSLSDERGGFCFGALDEGESVEVRVLASDELELPAEVTDFYAALYSVRAGPFVVGAGPVTVRITQGENAGAFAIFETMRGGLLFARTAFARADLFPTQSNRWEKGNSTPGGTSYFAGDAIWLLGGPMDTDEYDTAVILHELGHYIEAVYGATDTGSGSPHAGADTDPRLAWSEGWATHFSNLASGSGEYLDSYGDGIALNYDVATLPLSGEYAGNASGGLSQNLSEWLIAASLYRLYEADTPATQSARMMAVIRDWFDPLVTDRGAGGGDFVDYLDGYLCLNADLHHELIMSHIVGERTFPYDFAGSCPAPKPGRPYDALSADLNDRREPPGQVLTDARGRTLREAHIDRVR